jgi:hypothetical protein
MAAFSKWFLQQLEEPAYFLAGACFFVQNSKTLNILGLAVNFRNALLFPPVSSNNPRPRPRWESRFR